MPFYRKKSVISRRNDAMVHRFNAAVASARARLQKKLAKKKECNIEPLFSNTDLTVLRLPRDCVSATDVLSGVFPLTDKCSEVDNKMGCLFTDSSLCSLHIRDSIVSGVVPLTDSAVESPEEMLFEDIKQPFRIAAPCDSGYSGVFPLTDWAETPSQFKLFSDMSSTSNISPSKFFSRMSQTSLLSAYSLTESEIYKWLIDDLTNKIATLDISKPSHSYSSVVSGVFPLTDHLHVESTWDLTGFFDEPARCPSFELSVRDMRTDESEHLSGVFPLSDVISATSIESNHLTDPVANVSSLNVTSDHLSGIFPLTDRVTSEDRFLHQIRKTTLLLRRIREHLDEIVVPVSIKMESVTSIDSGYLADADESDSITSIYTEKSWYSSDMDTGYDSELSDLSMSDEEEFKKSGQTLSDIFNDLFGYDYAIKRRGAGMDPELQKFNGFFHEEDVNEFFSTERSAVSCFRLIQK